MKQKENLPRLSASLKDAGKEKSMADEIDKAIADPLWGQFVNWCVETNNGFDTLTNGCDDRLPLWKAYLQGVKIGKLILLAQVLDTNDVREVEVTRFPSGIVKAHAEFQETEVSSREEETSNSKRAARAKSFGKG